MPRNLVGFPFVLSLHFCCRFHDPDCSVQICFNAGPCFQDDRMSSPVMDVAIVFGFGTMV